MTRIKQRTDQTILLESKPLADPRGQLNWSPDLPMEQWDGVTVRDGRVIALYFDDVAEKEDFEKHGMEGAYDRLLLRGGHIPPDWGELDALQVLCIIGTGLEGRIPPEIGACGALTGLQIAENDVNPQMPPELGRCTMLRVLYLDCLEGSVPGGTIPPELGNCSHLEHLNLSTLCLSGDIPVELANCTQLKTLYLCENNLPGTIPDALGSLQQLTALDLSDNKLTGDLSASIGGNRPLCKLMLDHNRLTGTVPETFSACYALDSLFITDSGLSGPLPDALASRAQSLDGRMEDDGHVLFQVAQSSSEAVAFLSTQWPDRTVKPLLVDLGVMEPEFPIEDGWRDRWPPPPTPENPSPVCVGDECALEDARGRQPESSSLGM